MKHEPIAAAATAAKPLTKAAKKAARRAAKEAAAVAAAVEALPPKLSAEEELEPVAAEAVVAPLPKKKAAATKAEKVARAEKRAIARTIRMGDAANWKRDLHIGQKELAEALAVFEIREGRLPT